MSYFFELQIYWKPLIQGIRNAKAEKHNKEKKITETHHTKTMSY
jgi:hypothetical protein